MISIGGGIGDDGKAIETVFKSRGLRVPKCRVIDPNFLAAWLASEQGIDFYAATAQEYFSQFFTREGDGRCVFHLGTLLNVVPEHIALDILQLVTKNMVENDILSVVMVDEKQFTILEKKQQIKRKEFNNPAGLTRYVYTDSELLYKTVISDRLKFLNFCNHLGLKTIDFTETKEYGKTIVQVTFIVFKGIKVESDKSNSP